MAMVAALPQACDSGPTGGTRSDPDRTMGHQELAVGGEPVRAVPQRVVSQSLLSPGHGADLCRRAQTLFRYQALVAASAGTYSSRRGCEQHLCPGISHAALEPAGAAHNSRPSIAA